MQAIGHLLPFAVALALSAVPILATLFILLSPNRSRSALPFLIGWVVGIFVVAALCTLVAQAVPAARSPRRPDTVIGALEIIIGAALIVLAIFSFRRARKRAATPIPNWLKSSGSLGPWSSLGLALVLNIRPKALLIAVAAGLTVRADADTLTDAVIALAIYTVIAASTVARADHRDDRGPRAHRAEAGLRARLADPQRRGDHEHHRRRDRRRHRRNGPRTALKEEQ